MGFHAHPSSITFTFKWVNLFHYIKRFVTAFFEKNPFSQHEYAYVISFFNGYIGQPHGIIRCLSIVSSGYSDDPVLANFQEYGFKGMMPKPFEYNSLSKVLHEVLKSEKN